MSLSSSPVVVDGDSGVFGEGVVEEEPLGLFYEGVGSGGLIASATIWWILA